MSPRFIILVVLAGGLAIYLATRTAAPAEEVLARIPSEINTIEETDINMIPIDERDLAGEAPSEPADFDVRVEVDPGGTKTRLFYYITEKHGYYVEAPQLLLWHVAQPGHGLEDTNLEVPHLIGDFIQANVTYKGCIDITPSELGHVGDDIGTDRNWAAYVEEWGRTRLQDPDPLPTIVHAMSCD